jgi:hypothetical protein
MFFFMESARRDGLRERAVAALATAMKTGALASDQFGQRKAHICLSDHRLAIAAKDGALAAVAFAKMAGLTIGKSSRMVRAE